VSSPGSAVIVSDAGLGWQAVDMTVQAGLAGLYWQYGTANQSCTETAPAITVSLRRSPSAMSRSAVLVTGTVTVGNEVNYPLTLSLD